MKKVFLLTILVAFLTSCDEPTTQTKDGATYFVHFEEIHHEEHDYLVLSDRLHFCGITHSENCPCKKR